MSSKGSHPSEERRCIPHCYHSYSQGGQGGRPSFHGSVERRLSWSVGVGQRTGKKAHQHIEPNVFSISVSWESTQSHRSVWSVTPVGALPPTSSFYASLPNLRPPRQSFPAHLHLRSLVPCFAPKEAALG